MKLHKRVLVAGETYPIVDHNIRLNLFSPGRSAFTVQSKTTLSGVVFFDCGYQASSLTRWFIGYVESCTKVDEHQQRIFCRELTGVLYGLLPLALRDADLNETLAAITKATGLDFVLPVDNKPYTAIKAPAFYNMASGYHAMDSMAAVFNIPKLIWQQQVSGKVYVGSWDDSRWANRPVTLPNNWERDVTVANGATIPPFPSMRPGALYNGNVVTSVEFTGSKMAINWASNPWAKR